MRANDGNIRLTSRDIDILRDVYDNTLLTFGQIQGRHFAGAARVTVQNRLTQLTVAGYLCRRRIGSVVHQSDLKFIGVIYQVTRLGLRVLQELHPQVAFRTEPVVLDTNALVHDLKLIGVLDFLKKRFGKIKWANAKNVLGQSQNGIRQPDLIGFGFTGERLVAVELELSVKSERTYRDIINQYGITRTYKNVLYITGSDAIRDKIREAITGIKAIKDERLFPTGRFYFVRLQDLDRPVSDVKITNGLNDFDLEIARLMTPNAMQTA